ncbi:coiled-coil domain-containing protein [Noviherbaspirillum soli]|uniref:coiled-coil domain-containing protein n=1 Tax=Noviherbaspirillum soli TaxID=1064518 RepID=UPI00188CADDF|nr:coiled-coil domain-containing protein [Noviherbaspirillum soli]
MTMTIQFDTLRYVEKLRSAGMPEAHAKASAEALSTVLEQSTSTTLATKEDISVLKEDLGKVRTEVSALRNDLDIKTSELRSEFRSEFTQIRADMKLMHWMLATSVVTGLSLFAKSFF